ncbi:MAG TPA: hypothetical protein VKS81_03550 [Bacteroidota bacterium]|nr:hypothetical protein [Bacteroidota bacterium]
MPSRICFARLCAVAALVCVWLAFTPSELRAQDVTVEASSISDPNIFDNYSDYRDNIYQLGLFVSDDWDVSDESTLSASYGGSLQLFNTLSTRNYNVNVITLSWITKFENDDDDEDTTSDEDSTSADSTQDDSTKPIIAPVKIKPPVVKKIDSTAINPADDDSLSRAILGTATGSKQFDKVQFDVYDNSKIVTLFGYRQPLGNRMAIAPFFTASYHDFANLEGITNYEFDWALQFKKGFSQNGWFDVTVSYGAKHYPISTSYSDTAHVGKSGHGKNGAGGGLRIVTFELSTPSVAQFVSSIFLHQHFFSGTDISLVYNFFGEPSSIARLIQNQLGNGVGIFNHLGTPTFNSQNEIFDDHYAFRANDINVSLQQTIPWSFVLSAALDAAHKIYTLPAYDLTDSIVASQRIDDRIDLQIGLSYPIMFTAQKNIKPRIGIEFLRNSSNAAYYDFDKSVYSFGVEINY